MKIYTKTGDQGLTGLFGGKRVSKHSPRILAYGEVDELNAVIGMAIAECHDASMIRALHEIQSNLFIVGAQLASPSDTPSQMEIITASQVEALERQIDVVTQDLPPLKHFILPGGCRLAACLHLARTVCRRAERCVVSLSLMPQESVDKWLLIYLNRLSDFLFTIARLANQLANVQDVEWTGRKDPKNNSLKP